MMWYRWHGSYTTILGNPVPFPYRTTCGLGGNGVSHTMRLENRTWMRRQGWAENIPSHLWGEMALFIIAYIPPKKRLKTQIVFVCICLYVIVVIWLYALSLSLFLSIAISTGICSMLLFISCSATSEKKSWACLQVSLWWKLATDRSFHVTSLWVWYIKVLPTCLSHCLAHTSIHRICKWVNLLWNSPSK